ncbi:hypothetical protein [Pelagicoccus mobilis]|uniref:Uncharacterized protein n=1 Tax=Pelagicoccus mobilis TaxID=415221 RepID=A0A934S208_9BACT|nr:hypothetical protein [Pelagicoccus mobilis]MBK1879166.1 hypothetical protein [Pelagicoccus mobilis]
MDRSPNSPTLSVTREEKGIVFDFSGPVLPNDIRQANSIFHTDTHFEKLSYSIWNFIDADLSQVDASHITILAAEDLGSTATNPDHKLALITENQDASDLFKYYININTRCDSSWSFRLCETEADSRNWIESRPNRKQSVQCKTRMN